MEVEGSKEKDSVKAVTWMSSVKTKFHNILKEIPALEYLLNKIGGLLPETVSKKRFQYRCFKKRLHYRCFHVSFARYSRHLFKVHLRQLLLKEHWILLKMLSIAITMNVCNSSYQKENILFSFSRFTHKKFV